jgi:hypothetical protein
MADWSICSNSGWQGVRFETIAMHKSIEQLEFRIQLKGKAWYRPHLHGRSPNYDLVDNYTMTLESVLLSPPACHRLIDDFDEWMASGARFRRSLTSSSTQSLRISTNCGKGLLTAPDKPSIMISYKDIGCICKVRFVIDQTCISIARAELSALLLGYDLF